MCLQLHDELLAALGLKKMEVKEFIPTSYRGDTPKEQWTFQGVILAVYDKDRQLSYRFFDKNAPNFTFGVQHQRQLENILNLIAQGKTVADLWVMEQELRGEEIERMLKLQQNKPFLEDYRYNDIGGSFFQFRTGTMQKVHMTYEKHTTAAYYYTLNDISNLEHAKDTVHTGVQTHSAIAFWFLALESYINSLVKICCIKKNLPFETYKKEDLHKRLGSLARLLELDLKSFYENNIVAKVNEFAWFRNDLFHDRHFIKELDFAHTSFSPIPIFSCQVDIMQAILILLETTSMLRYAIAGFDTMPSVILKNADIVVWEKLDIAYEKILQPWFAGVLDKHHMRTKLEYEFRRPLGFRSTAFQEGEISCSVIVEQDPQYEYWLNGMPTNIGIALHNEHLNSYQAKPGSMLLDKVVLSS